MFARRVRSIARAPPSRSPIFSIHTTEAEPTSIPILRSLYFFLRSGGDNENGQTRRTCSKKEGHACMHALGTQGEAD